MNRGTVTVLIAQTASLWKTCISEIVLIVTICWRAVPGLADAAHVVAEQVYDLWQCPFRPRPDTQ